jgi:hypothetical protein
MQKPIPTLIKISKELKLININQNPKNPYQTKSTSTLIINFDPIPKTPILIKISAKKD